MELLCKPRRLSTTPGSIRALCARPFGPTLLHRVGHGHRYQPRVPRGWVIDKVPHMSLQEIWCHALVRKELRRRKKGKPAKQVNRLEHA